MKPLHTAGVLFISTVLSASGLADAWTDNSFDAFRKGEFLDGGSNLYVSASGRVQMINRWDLNGDGFLDIVMPSGHAHTEKEDTYIYLNSGDDIDGHSLIKLPANGSRDGLVADFNKDGFNDIAVCNGDNGITTRTDAYVYYGAREGFSVHRRVTLPAHASNSIAAGDFDGDGWTDLAIACQWQDGDISSPTGPKCSFVYWNGPNGFDRSRRTTLSFDGTGALAVAAGNLDADATADLILLTGKCTLIAYGKDRAIEDASRRVELPYPATACATGDIDGDGKMDLALCVGNEVLILRGPSFVDLSAKLSAMSPRDVVLQDLNRDGRDDVVVANYATREGATWVDSYIYWSDGRQFTSRPRTELPTMGASAISAGDLNGDGNPELVFGNERVLNQCSIPSLVYWNENGQFQKQHRTELETQGCVSNAIGDVNNDGKPDIVFFNFEGNFRDGPSVTHIYWGDGTRDYTMLRRTELDTHYITSVAHADLNDDGFVDLVLTQARFISQVREDLFNSIIICWGSKDGFIACTRLTVDDMAGGVRIADLNRDGFLDLVVGAICTEQDNGMPRKGIPIFWGGKRGFSQQRRTIISPVTDYPRVPLIADLNLDGYLDLVNQVKFGTFTIWWGKGDGSFSDETTTINLQRPDQLVFINSADLNKDGWPDLILPCRKVGADSEVSSSVYYGSKDGFSSSRREELSSTGIYETSAADLDHDNWLDLVFSSYQGNFKRNFPSLIYWGSEHGFAQRPRTELPTYAASGVETADYDGDGFCDILLSNHRIDGSSDAPGPHNHKANSMLYWGSEKGFSAKARWDFPTNGPHAMNVRDVGNGLDRGLYEDYLSAPHELPSGSRIAGLSWIAQTPHGTTVQFQLRTSGSRENLNHAKWTGPNGENSWFDTSGAEIANDDGPWVQYRARFTTPNGGPTPSLTSVTVRSAP